jgi:hypothetical protein
MGVTSRIFYNLSLEGTRNGTSPMAKHGSQISKIPFRWNVGAGIGRRGYKDFVPMERGFGVRIRGCLNVAILLSSNTG